NQKESKITKPKYMENRGAKKSLYVFMTSLLGVLLFLILHRIVVFFYLFSIAGGYIGTSFNYIQFIALDYFTITITMLLGAWYGTWLGLYWYGKVYEEGSHMGFIHHLASNYFPRKSHINYQSQMSEV